MKRRPNFSKATFLNLKPAGQGRGAGVTARSLRDSGAGFGMPTTIPNCSVGSVGLQEQGEISLFYFILIICETILKDHGVLSSNIVFYKHSSYLTVSISDFPH